MRGDLAIAGTQRYVPRFVRRHCDPEKVRGPQPSVVEAHSFHWPLILCLCQGSRPMLPSCSAYCIEKAVLLRTRKIIVNQFHSCTGKAEAGVSGS